MIKFQKSNEAFSEWEKDIHNMSDYSHFIADDKSLIIVDNLTGSETVLKHIDNVYNDRFFSETFDTIENMMAYINQHRKYYSQSFYTSFSIIAYEIINEHYIKLYYQIRSSNS